MKAPHAVRELLQARRISVAVDPARRSGLALAASLYFSMALRISRKRASGIAMVV